MKAKFTSYWSMTLGSILAILGFTGCDKSGLTEYGTPSVRYKIRGTVVDETTGKPVEGLRTVLYNADQDKIYQTDTLYTDRNGEFDFNKLFYTFALDELSLKIEDVDGAENGLYGDKDLTVDLTGVEYSNASGKWYRGQATVDLCEIAVSEPDESATSGM
ncbi:MAG: radical SAM-associated putative lipoprotein [Rikenellaceae bacterium]|nr:radical SAM-associated putative lipoprotein [Rikenellaceae bacterium]